MPLALIQVDGGSLADPVVLYADGGFAPPPVTSSGPAVIAIAPPPAYADVPPPTPVTPDYPKQLSVPIQGVLPPLGMSYAAAAAATGSSATAAPMTGGVPQWAWAAIAALVLLLVLR